MNIREILEELVKKIYAGKEVENVSVTKAHQAIISLILETMPKEKELSKPTIEELEELLDSKSEIYIKPDGSLLGITTSKDLYERGVFDGFNLALVEMRENLKEI